MNEPPHDEPTLEELDALFGDRTELTPTTTPPHLLEATLRRLEAEGLVGSPPPVPAGLLDATLEGLESQGLVRPAKPALWRRVALAAAALLVGILVGWLVRGEKIVERPVEKITVRTVEKIVEKPIERVVEKIVERTVERVVERIVEKLVERIVEKPLERGATGVPTFAVPSSEVSEHWSAREGSWRSVAPGTRLAPGELVRGALGGRVFVLDAEGKLVPVPERRVLNPTPVASAAALRPQPEESFWQRVSLSR